MGMVIDLLALTTVITRDSKELALSFDIVDRLLEPKDRFCKLYFRNDESDTDGIPKALCVYMNIYSKDLIIDMGIPISANGEDDYDDEPIVSSDNGERWTTGRINLCDPWGSVIDFLNSFEKILKIEKNINNLKRVGIDDLTYLYNEVSRVFMQLTGCAAFQMLKYAEDTNIAEELNADQVLNAIGVDICEENMREIFVRSKIGEDYINIKYHKEYHDYMIKLFWKLMYCITNHPIYPGEKGDCYDRNNEG